MSGTSSIYQISKGLSHSLTVSATNSNHVLLSSIQKYKYNILGEDIESDSVYGDQSIAMIIALINVLGIKYYVELKKQGITLHGKVGDFLEYKLKSYLRDDKIEEVLENK